MTGIIICDNCKKAFHSHGGQSKIPKMLGRLDNFNGVRIIESANIGGTLFPEFKDYCIGCYISKKLWRKKND